MHGPGLTKRRVLIGEVEPVEAEELRLESEPPLGDRIGRLDAFEHPVDGGRGQLVSQVCCGHGARVLTDTVDHEAIADEGVVAMRERVGLRHEPLEERGHRSQPEASVGVSHEGQQAVDGEGLFAVAGIERDLERRGDASEERLPRGDRGGVPLREHPLLGLGEQMRGESSLRDEVVPISCNLRRVGERERDVFGKRGPLEFSEPKEVAGLDHRLIDLCCEVAVLLRLHVDGLAQVCVGGHPRQVVVDRGKLGEHCAKTRAVEPVDLPAVSAGEGSASIQGTGQFSPARVGVGDEPSKVPASPLGQGNGVSSHQRQPNVSRSG